VLLTTALNSNLFVYKPCGCVPVVFAVP